MAHARTQVADFLITGPDYAWRGVGGIRAAGFWAADWAVDERSAYFSGDEDARDESGADADEARRRLRQQQRWEGPALSGHGAGLSAAAQHEQGAPSRRSQPRDEL